MARLAVAAADIVGHEAAIRATCFVVASLLVAWWEYQRPRRRAQSRLTRWPAHFALAGVNAVVVRLIAPAAGATFALWAARQGWGVLRQIEGPGWLEAVLAVLTLDVAVYGQHRLFHSVPWLWRMHRVHHADVEFDVSTGVRFHPSEIAVSTLFKGAAIVLIGASPLAAMAFEVVLSTSSLFSHANGRLSGPSDSLLRAVLVTPDMHRVHHSVDPAEHNTNFGFSVSWWDRLFRTYRPAASQPPESMIIGLRQWRDPRDAGLLRLLRQPLEELTTKTPHVAKDTNR